jgi:exopolysaccharide biosynthesis polyprenyl glycosylphosphotransferase
MDGVRVAQIDSPRARIPAGPEQPAPRPLSARLHLLTRLNARGFRLAHLMDFTSLYTLLVVTRIARRGEAWPDYPRWQFLLSFVLATLVVQTSLYFGGLYGREPRLGRPPAVPRAARQVLMAGGALAMANLIATGVARRYGIETDRLLPMPTVDLIALIVIGPLLVSWVRMAAKVVRTRREGPPRVLLVGSHDDVVLARTHLQAAGVDHVDVVGAVHDLSDAAAAASRRNATDVLLLDSENLDEVQASLLPELERNGRMLLLRVSAADTLYGLQRLREVGGLPFLLVGAQAMPPYRRRLKRLTDLTMVMVLLPLLLLCISLTGAYVRLMAGGPVLFWQTRVGAGGHEFQMVKFRTMRPDAEEDGRARLADVVDDRVVRGLGFLRSTRLDELPQLWNILRGEMGLVGPRPERPELTSQFEQSIPGYARRHEVPPGITGLAQIHGRYHTDAEYKLGYDLQYLINWSPVLDLEILVRTVWVILARRV